MQLRSKFLALGGVSVLLVGGVVMANAEAGRVSRAHMTQSSAIMRITQRHMEGDMMHDAMRGDVLAGLVARAKADSDGFVQARKELGEHAAKFERALKENQAEALPDALKQDFDSTLNNLMTYRAAGEAVMDASEGRTDEALTTFNARFSAMEDSNEALSGRIEDWMKTVEARSSAEERRTGILVLVLSALAIAGVALMSLLLWRDILKPLGGLSQAISRIAGGDTDAQVEFVKRNDEIGILASATETLRMTARKAFLVDRMVQTMPTPVMSVDASGDFTVSYANEASLGLVERLKAHFPKYKGELVGQSIDMFHHNPSHQRQILSNPANLPYRTRIQIGEESIDLQISAVLDRRNQYAGAMLMWDIVTDQAQLSRDFEVRVQDVVSALASSAADLSQVAETVTGELKKNAGLASSSSAAATQASSSVQTVAAAAEEMAASIREISDQVQTANRLVSESFQKVEDAGQVAQKLSGASDRVAEVTTVIADISSQINLLALNATIESARAGEAGRGFAVVAGEVKNLANQTSRSIGEINGVIDDMRSATREIVTVLGDIRSAVDAITHATTSVAAAVEEQTVTTQDIARNMAFAADGTRMISDNLEHVSSATARSEDASAHLFDSSQSLSDQAETLRGRVAEFISRMNRSAA